MKKAIYLLNFLLLALMIALDVLLILRPTLTLKSTASACFVAVGVINAAYSFGSGAKKKFPVLMLLGLVVAMAGDIIIYPSGDIWFICGAALFAVAHIFYVAAYFCLYKFRIADLIAAVCVFLPSVLFITLAPIFDFGGAVMEIVCVAYAFILSLMVGKALSGLSRGTALSVVVAAGSILFYISDLSLLLNMFGTIHKIPRIICLATYYPAQFLLAFALILYCERGLNFFKRLYCRIFQTVLKIALPFLPYKNPSIVDRVADIPAVLKKNAKSRPLIVTDKTI
ncbi:MAG: lysoplasmalogenase, partial [Clostridia bacterium]|nr:lysoplasmalogenase [Clostridia bacterium]